MAKRLDFSDPRNCVFFNLRHATRAMMNFYDAEIRRAGLRATQGSMLIALQHKKTWTMSELGEALGVERTTLLRNLRPLQRDGWVSAESDGPGGKVLLSLTPKGHQQIQKYMPAWNSVQQTAVKVLGEDRWTEILRDLQTVTHLLCR